MAQVVGILEQDVPYHESIKYPSLYEAGPLRRFFGYRQFAEQCALGFFHSVMILVFTANCMGPDDSIFTFGLELSAAVIIVVTVELGIRISGWTIWHNHSMAFGVVMFFAYFAIVYSYNSTTKPSAPGVEYSPGLFSFQARQ